VPFFRDFGKKEVAGEFLKGSILQLKKIAYFLNFSEKN